MLGPAHRRIAPHIYATKQTGLLLGRAAALTPAGSLRPLTFFTLIGLLVRAPDCASSRRGGSGRKISTPKPARSKSCGPKPAPSVLRGRSQQRTPVEQGHEKQRCRRAQPNWQGLTSWGSFIFSETTIYVDSTFISSAISSSSPHNVAFFQKCPCARAA